MITGAVLPIPLKGLIGQSKMELMSGVFGIIAPRAPQRAEAVLPRMAAHLKLREWFRAQTWADPAAGIGLGQLNIGIFGTEPQPARSADGAVTAFFFGSLYNAEELRQILQERGHTFPAGTDAELVLRLYEDRGEEVAAALNGTFGLCVWDARHGRLLLANDRLGLIPHYYAHFNGRLVFAPQVNAVLQDPDFERRLDLTSTAEFIRFQRLLGDKTFFEGLHLLPFGSTLIYDARGDTLKVGHYWDFDRIPSWPAEASFEDAVIETGRLLRRAVGQCLAGTTRPGVYVSGGLDSRTLLGFASDGRPAPPSVTYGHPRSTDVAYGRQVARAVGSQNHYVPEPDGKWLARHADFHLAVTEGHTSFIHAHSAPSLEPARQWLDVNLIGLNGDVIIGARGIDYAISAACAPDDLAFLAHMHRHMTCNFSWPGPTDAEERLLYTSAYYPQMRDRAFESLACELRPYNRFAMHQRVDYFIVVYQGTRLTNLNAVYMEAFFEVRFPFCDYALMDCVLSMPLPFRAGDRLYLAVLNREIPRVTRVPRATDDKLLTDRALIRRAHHLQLRARRRIGRALFPTRTSQQIHGNPEDWLRNDLGDWAAAILFDRRTAERGIFNPAYLRSIFDRHMSGKEIGTIGKIAPLVTFEMMMRRFFD